MWSNRVEEAGWIAARSGPEHPLPAGYEAYARLLHPICPDPSDAGERPTRVRWAQVAAWSGVPLLPTTAFWQLALPERLPAEPMPGGGAPASDVLGAVDGAALAGLLRGHTAAPEQCWFAIWDGYGWEGAGDPVPAEIRAGPRVRLPDREYLLYTGPVEAGMAFLPDRRELADLWWPADRAWFVYGDVDLNCTYVGGSAALIQRLVTAPGLEALPAGPAGPATISTEVPEWLAARIETAARELVARGSALLSVTRFVVRLALGHDRLRSRTRDGRLLEDDGLRIAAGGWGLRYWVDAPECSGWQSLDQTADLLPQLRQTITRIVIDTVEG